MTCPTCNTKAGCEAYSYCSSENSLGPILAETGLSGVCVSTPTTDDGDPCCGPACDDPIPEGCVEPAYTSSIACTTTGYQWYTVATNEPTCEARSGMSSPSCLHLHSISHCLPRYERLLPFSLPPPSNRHTIQPRTKTPRTTASGWRSPSVFV